ncbi:hypothetical protein [Pseudarthrobacter sp. SSS035]|uniref:hypothetical protein n=1 Tax=Pseudarthrobacter sp. SSS035 TaxID=2931399 RepID=UPI00200C61F7|nr:hypothetical protein [Pseudarthrobacter sp. SSS035]
MSGGELFIFTGSWCSPGKESSWNAAWRISGEHGKVLWDGDNEPTLDSTGTPAFADSEDPELKIAGALRDFVQAIRTGNTPMGQVHENIMSLAMVEAAMLSASTRSRVSLDTLLEDSYQECLLTERNPGVLEVLKSWPSVRAALSAETSRLP